MKLTSVSILLALTTAAVAIPAEDLQKRATCTFFGWTYPCASNTATTPTTTTTKASVPTTTKAQVTTTTSARATTTTSIRYTTTTTTTSATSPTSKPPSTGGSSKYTSGATASDITSDTGCTDLTVIFARGTTESGNIGYVVGPPLFKQLLSDLGASSLTLQGVNYPADNAGNANCGAAGGADMANAANTILSRCPNTKVVLTGYSQGACVVHNAVERQGLDASKVAATVTFGDPFNGQAVGKVPTSKSLSICASGDSICGRGPSGNGSGSGHTSYGGDAKQAADFIEKVTGV